MSKTLNTVIQFKGQLYVICKNKMYTYDNADPNSNWITAYKLFDDEQDRQMSLKITLGVTPVMVVVGAGRDVWSADGVVWHDAGIQKACQCSVKILMQAGCKCGGA